jgi:hypothetical protein
MADFNPSEFFRQKMRQDQINGVDPSYDPNSSAAWLEHAVKFPAPESNGPSVQQTNLAQPTSDSGTSQVQAPRQLLSQAIAPQTQSAGDISFPQFTPDASAAIGQTQPEQSSSTGFQQPNIGPKEEAAQEVLGQTPLRSDYHPSTMRKIMGTVGGIATGLGTSDPKQAIANKTAIQDKPYSQQLQQFNQGLGIKQAQAQDEIGAVSRAATQQEQMARTGAEQARMEQENAHRQQLEYQNSPEGRDFQLTLAGVKKPQDYEAKDKAGNLHHLTRDLKSGKLIDSDTGMPIEMAALARISDPGKSLRESQDKAPTNPFELWHSQNPETDVEEWFKLPQNKPVKGEWEQYREEALQQNPKANIRSLIKDFESLKAAADQKPSQTLIVNPATGKFEEARPGGTAPAGFTTPQQSGATATKKQTEIDGINDDKEFVNDYLTKQPHTGPGDEALLERFFNATKPSTGFRMNQSQIALLTKLRSWSSSAKAAYAHATGGNLFDDKQRGEIVDAINQISDIKLKNRGGMTVAPPGQSSGNQLPGGISIQDIDAEIARRKGKK